MTNERESLDGMLRKEHEKGLSVGYLKLMPCEEAESLVKGAETIEGNGHVDETLISICYRAFGGNVLTNPPIPNKAQHYKWDTVSVNEKGLRKLRNEISLSSELNFNLLLAAAYISYGRRQKGLNLLRKTTRRLEVIGFDDGTKIIKRILPVGGKKTTVKKPNHTLWWLNTSLAFAYLAYEMKDDALQLIRGIENHIGFTDYNDGSRLVKTKTKQPLHEYRYSEHSTAYQSLLAAEYFCFGEINNGQRIIEGIEHHIVGRKKKHPIFLELKDGAKLVANARDRHYYVQDSVALAIAYMAREFQAKNKDF